MEPESVKRRAAELSDEIIGIRRMIHRHPELSFMEHETARLIGNVLDDWGIIHHPVADTGITGVIEGNGPGRYLVLRADIDALPVEEETGAEYSSEIPGVMHACGHDVHTASLLGAVRILAETSDSWEGSVRFIFQPGEEVLPGGALKVLESGLLDEPIPDFVIAQHVYPELPAGTFGFRAGPYMASTDEIHITVKGVGGHGALPHKVVDPVLIASHLVVGLQQIVSRKIPADVPAVLSFGRFEARGSTNVIPSTATLAGTFRIMNEAWRKTALEEIRQTAEGIALSMGATLDCRIVSGYPSLVNDIGLTSKMMDLATKFAGINRVSELPMRMTGEDFARYAQRFPSGFYRLGTGGENREFPVHHPRFDVDESAITHGMGMMAWLALGLLSR